MAERNRDAAPGMMTGFTSLGFSKGPNIQPCSCPHAGRSVRPGADRSVTRARAFSVRRLPDP